MWSVWLLYSFSKKNIWTFKQTRMYSKCIPSAFTVLEGVSRGWFPDRDPPVRDPLDRDLPDRDSTEIPKMNMGPGRDRKWQMQRPFLDWETGTSSENIPCKFVGGNDKVFRFSLKTNDSNTVKDKVKQSKFHIVLRQFRCHIIQQFKCRAENVSLATNRLSNDKNRRTPTNNFWVYQKE